MSTSAELYLFYVTMTDNTGKVSHTWMANSNNFYIAKQFAYSERQQWGFSESRKPSAKTSHAAHTLHPLTGTGAGELLDKLENIKQKGGSTIKSEYKIMSLKSAVNFHIKKMKEAMEKRCLVTVSEYNKTETGIQKDIEIVSKDIKEIPIYI